MHHNMQLTKARKPRRRSSADQSTLCDNTYGIPKRFAQVMHRGGSRISVKTTFFITDSPVTVVLLSLMLTSLQRACALLSGLNHAAVQVFTALGATDFVANFRSTLTHPIHAPTPRHPA